MMDVGNIVTIGGGTGLSTMLRGLKLHTSKVTAVVTVADDGGSSGILRKSYNMPPPGDVRNCVSALTDMTKEFRELLNYRFKDGSFKGHSVGNIMLAAINETSSSFEEAVRRYCRIVGVSGAVLPVTSESLTLHARLKSGKTVDGESNISIYRPNDGIDEVFATPKASASGAVVDSILGADVIIMGPGSLYTSIIPNFLVDGVVDAIKESKALKIYVCNIMTQPGETDGYDAHDHLAALEKYTYKGVADAVIANDAEIPKSLLDKYFEEEAHPVLIDEGKMDGSTRWIMGSFYIMQDGQIRHNFSRLATTIIRTARNMRKGT
ncbi:MAG: YvcK family protein [Clostridiales bacterium]|nr:YvcK family protein [Clostridiales bacterium]